MRVALVCYNVHNIHDVHTFWPLSYMHMKINTKEKIEESFVEVLSDLPLSKAQNLLAFVNYLKIQRAVESEGNFLRAVSSLPILSFVEKGILRNQIYDAVEILQALYEKIHGEKDLSISSGVLNVCLNAPTKIRFKGGKDVIEGLGWIPIDRLLQYLLEKIEIMEGTIGKINTRNNTSFEEIKERVPEPAPQTISEKNGIGYLDLDGRKTEIGPAKNMPFKLLEALCPFGVPKGIGAIFKASLTGRSKHKEEGPLSPDEKQGILRHRIKELQKILKKKKIKVSLVFDTRAETVFLKLN